MLISCGTLKKQNGGNKDIRKANFDNIAFVFFSEKRESYSEGNQGRNSVGTNQSEVNKSHFQRKYLPLIILFNKRPLGKTSHT